MLELTRLRMLLEIHRRGSIAAAAKQLHLTPSAVSQQLKLLAKEVETDLLQRVPGGVRLTGAGILLAEHAERAMAELAAAEESLAVLKGSVGGELRVGCFPSAARALLPGVLAGLAMSYPDLTVTLRSLNSGDAVGALMAGEVDAAFVASYEHDLPDDSVAQTVRLGNDPLKAIGPRCHPLFQTATVALADLAEEPWLLDAESSMLHRVVNRACRQAGFVPRVRSRCPDSAITVAMAEAGLGVAILPRMAIMEAPVAALPIVPPMSRSVGLAVRRSRRRLPAMRALVDHAARLCPPLLEVSG